MSKLTGKCDLYDHIYMLGRDTNDSMSKLEKFNVFKQRTGGKMYQSVKVELTKYNVDYFLDNDNNLTKGENGYEYWGKTFKTLNQLNKWGYWYKRTIEFETIFDVIPYLGHIISSIASDKDGDTVFIAPKSYPEMRYEESLEIGYPRDRMLEFYRLLQEEFKETLKEVENETNRCR